METSSLTQFFNKLSNRPKLEYLLVAVFVLLRILSFATYHHPILNAIVAGILMTLFIATTIRSLEYGWVFLVAELLLDGSGHYFELFGLLMRTWFLGIFAIIWLVQKIKTRKIELNLPKKLTASLILVAIVITWATINGFVHYHNPHYILQDTILYLFLALLIPAIEYRDILQKYIKPIITTLIIGSTIFSLVTFIIYSAKLGTLPDLYYHWFRNVAGGKITDLGNLFFRIVLSEHLFVVPLILVFASKLIADLKNKKLWIAISLLLLVLVLNFTRIYFIAMALGFFVLAIKNSISKWFKVSVISACIFVAILASVSFISSRFTSVGLELFGLKITQIRAPQTDLSGAIRLAMLPDIYNTISTHPLLGSGLATLVTYPDPLTKELVLRTQFDWGYFEMIAELGGIGTLIYISFLILILYYFARLAYTKKSPLYQGLFAGAIALFVINITTPALFQGFGVLYFVYIISLLSEKNLTDVFV